jgi:hypothetical protein
LFCHLAEIGTFSKTVSSLVEILVSQSSKIESEKLAVSGQDSCKMRYGIDKPHAAEIPLTNTHASPPHIFASLEPWRRQLVNGTVSRARLRYADSGVINRFYVIKRRRRRRGVEETGDLDRGIRERQRR